MTQDTLTKIKPVGLVHTPSGWPELEDWLGRLHSSERATATIAALMAWNLACQIINPKED